MIFGKNIEGNGKTKETALFLNNSMNRRDHIAFQYTWLAENGLKSHKTMLKPGENGFMYDVHITNQGSVWFKTPAIKIQLSINGVQKEGAV